jgi:hypothetical protein
VCQGGTCQEATCSDTVKNGSEGDADCGATCPELCSDGRPCGDDSHCESGVCDETCQMGTCEDRVRNQGEPDIDCGGPCSKSCKTGQSCAEHEDCVTGACESEVCEATLRIFYRTDASTDSVWIQPYLEIHNSGGSPAPLRDLEIRYFYTHDQTSQFPRCDYAHTDCKNVIMSFEELNPPRPLANYYFALTFGPDSLSVPANGRHRFEVAFRKDGFVPYEQSDDYSYDASKSSYSQHDEVCIYRDGVLIWGTEPEVEAQ